MREYRNIIVNSLANLGDVVLTTSAISLLRKAYPQAKITMLARPVVSEVIKNNPVIDDVIIFDYKSKQKSFRKMWEMVKEIRRRNFDLAISFDAKLRPALLYFFAGIPVRVTGEQIFDKKPGKVSMLFTNVIKLQHDLMTSLQAETFQEIVRGFTGITGSEVPCFARIETENAERAKILLNRLPQGKKRIGLCVKGTFALKTWPKEYFAELVRKLYRQYDAVFFIIGAPNDRAYANEVIAEIGLPVENFCGDTGLVDLAALLSLADLFITVDTGASHIAATTGVPMLTIFGNYNSRRWHPISENARVLSFDPECCPCSYREDECPYLPKPKCLYGVTPNMALETCRELLERKSGITNDQ